MSNCTILTYTIYLQLLALANSAGDMTDIVDQLIPDGHIQGLVKPTMRSADIQPSYITSLVPEGGSE